MHLIYPILIRIYYILILLVSPWNEKARLWIKGRKNWRTNLRNIFSPEDRVIWFHCASLGEFEQGRTMIELVRTKQPDKKLLLTFFSPSGYEKRNNYPHVDHVAYLPLDTARNARDFLAIIPLEKAMFVKYEFWPNFLRSLYRLDIPTYLISGHFRKDQLFFKWYGRGYSKILKTFNHIFVQQRDSVDLLSGIGVSNVTIAGDTRFDRVVSASRRNADPETPFFSGDKRHVIIGGSTWEEDEKILKEIWNYYQNRVRLIVAPHEPSPKTIERLLMMFPEGSLFSKISKGNSPDTPVLIVDTIGHLSSLYRFGDIALIGGGFGKGIHNILEATAIGMPVFFGPAFERFNEAVQLVSLGGAHSVKNANDFKKICDRYFENDSELQKIKKLTREFTLKNTGATKIIFNKVFGE